MRVKLIAATEPIGLGVRRNAVDVVERAAAVCYDSSPTEDHRIARACARAGHMSVWEHISFTFEVEGVSRSLLAQLTRHRHSSPTVRSQRYCDEGDFEVIVPQGLNGNPRATAAMNSAMEQVRTTYKVMRHYGAAAEDARAVLPNACATTLVLTFNARALIEASRKRMCTRAQSEIRELFAELRRTVAPYAPEVALMMRPQCEEDTGHPYCRELKSCGRHPTLAEVYAYPKKAEEGTEVAR